MLRQPTETDLQGIGAELMRCELEGMRTIAALDAPPSAKAERAESWHNTIRILEECLKRANADWRVEKRRSRNWRRLALLSVPMLALLTAALIILALRTGL